MVPVRLAARRRLGSGPGTVAFLHATGFCKELWLPVWDEIGEGGGDLVAWDQPAHGDTPVPPHPFDWWAFAALVAGEAADLARPRLGVGHSSGAAMLAMAEILAPGTFERLVLVEPIVFPTGLPTIGDDHPLVRGAQRRRSRFPDRASAREWFRTRDLFAGWDTRALDAYVAHGLRPDSEGGLVLKCRPDDEAESYRAGGRHRAWERLGEVRVPVLVVAGEASVTHPPSFTARLTARFADAAHHLVPGASHFVPMQRPDLVAALTAG